MLSIDHGQIYRMVAALLMPLDVANSGEFTVLVDADADPLSAENVDVDEDDGVEGDVEVSNQDRPTVRLESVDVKTLPRRGTATEPALADVLVRVSVNVPASRVEESVRALGGLAATVLAALEFKYAEATASGHYLNTDDGEVTYPIDPVTGDRAMGAAVVNVRGIAQRVTAATSEIVTGPVE